MTACTAARGHLDTARNLRCSDSAGYRVDARRVDGLAPELQERRKQERRCHDNPGGNASRPYRYCHVDHGEQRVEFTGYGPRSSRSHYSEVIPAHGQDGKAIVWDTNRLRYTRMLQTPHNEPLLYSAINDSDVSRRLAKNYWADPQGNIALASSNHLYLFSLNGHPIASTTTDPDPLADFTFGLPESPSPQSTKVERFTGGITFLRRDYLRYGVLFVIGIEDELALFRCVPGERRFEDEEVKPWRLVEQGRLARSGECGGQCCMVKFIG